MRSARRRTSIRPTGSPGHGVTLRPSFVVRDRGREGQPPVRLVRTHPDGTRLDRPIPGEAWAASPIDRAAELAKATGRSAEAVEKALAD